MAWHFHLSDEKMINIISFSKEAKKNAMSYSAKDSRDLDPYGPLRHGSNQQLRLLEDQDNSRAGDGCQPYLIAFIEGCDRPNDMIAYKEWRYEMHVSKDQNAYAE